MAIDAFTLVAQVVNFALLLLLLRLVLFRPIQRVMAERERRIAAAHDGAERARDEAEAEAEALREERAELEAQRRERLAELEREVERTREERLAGVRSEAEAARASWREDLERQRDELDDELRRGAAAVLGDALRRGWRELADEGLEARALETFARRLRELDDGTRARLAEAAAAGPVLFATAFEATEAQRGALLAAASKALGAPIEAAFEREPDLLAGVTLRAGDLRVGWSVRAHVDDLERSWRDADTAAAPAAAAPAAAAPATAAAAAANARDAANAPDAVSPDADGPDGDA